MDSKEQLSSTTDGSFNTFNNDGSFFEQFKRMQEQQKQEKTAQSSAQERKTMTTSSFMPATLSSKRVTKSGAVIMKLSGVKKKGEPAVKLKKPPAALGDSSSEDEGDTEKKGIKF